MRSVAIVAAGMSTFGERFDADLDGLIVEAMADCCGSNRRLDVSMIEAGWLGMAAGSYVGREILTGATLGDPLRLFPRPVARVENACASGSEAVRSAYFAVASGQYEVVLVVGAEKMRDLAPRASLIAQTATVFSEWWQGRGLTAPARFALMADAYLAKFDAVEADLGAVARKNHGHGALNPKAYLRKEISIEEYLEAPMVATPLRLLDACPTTDGAAAIVLAAGEVAAELADVPVWIRGVGSGSDTFYSHQRPTYTSFSATKRALQECLRWAAPLRVGDVDVVELHDCFTISELIAYEDLGLCPEGAAARWLRAGGPALGGEVPCNPSGGLKAKGHPLGATGVAQLVELWEQLTGRAGARQVPRAEVGLAHNLGGIGTIANVTVLSTVP